MFGFVKKVFFVGLTILASFTNANSLYLNEEWKCKTRPQAVNVNWDEPLFFPFSIKTSKCSGSCNNINYPYAKICVPDVVKNLNVKVFNLMSRTNETRHIEWHEPCKRECKFGANICNNKQRWNKYNNCECECDKACDVGKYWDYENCQCRKELVGKLVNECAETVEEVKLAKTTLTENDNNHKCASCTVYIVSFSIIFRINHWLTISIFTGT